MNRERRGAYSGIASDEYADMTIRSTISGDKDPRLTDALKLLGTIYKRPIGLEDIAIVFQQGETCLYLIRGGHGL